jgi:hypothetical protein
MWSQKTGVVCADAGVTVAVAIKVPTARAQRTG